MTYTVSNILNYRILLNSGIAKIFEDLTRYNNINIYKRNDNNFNTLLDNLFV